MTSVPVITIDGPAAVGKGTVAKAVAAQLGFKHVDSGRYYRAISHLALKQQVDLNDSDAIIEATKKLDESQAMLKCLEDEELNSEQVGQTASIIAKLPAVRTKVNKLLNTHCQLPGIVADGRDMGTIVFTNASLKIFLDASADVREARARTRNSKAGGKISGYLNEFRVRDDRDSKRSIAPIEPADDAVVIDTSNLSVTEITTKITDLYASRQSTKQEI